MKIKVLLDEATRLTWAIRVIEQGDHYGLEDCLTHDKVEPLVEFFDTRYPHTDLGQFVSRYSLGTMLGAKSSLQAGLCLYGGVPEWAISARCFKAVHAWLTASFPALILETAGD